MKKILTLTAFAGLLVFGTSCSKKYDCTCTDSNGAMTVEKIGGANKDAAQVSCIAKSNVNSGKTCAILN
ncbi:MAG: hypothetical protein ACK4EY_02820 [Flavipsychrobacter sp.]|jgi:hypothetical protein|nr:hypothetical protein [Chitinophagales bacterium]